MNARPLDLRSTELGRALDGPWRPLSGQCSTARPRKIVSLQRPFFLKKETTPNGRAVERSSAAETRASGRSIARRGEKKRSSAVERSPQRSILKEGTWN